MLKPKPPKPRKCQHCKKPTINRYGLAVACNPECAIEALKARRIKKERKALREDRERIKTRQTWIKEAQSAFNGYIRERDRMLPCICCQRYHSGQYHAGHYRSVGSNPAIRFEPLNCHKSCQPCNTHLSGNLIEFRINLIAKIGLAKVEWLEGYHEPKKYTIEELKAIKAHYNKLRRALEMERL